MMTAYFGFKFCCFGLCYSMNLSHSRKKIGYGKLHRKHIMELETQEKHCKSIQRQRFLKQSC